MSPPSVWGCHGSDVSRERAVLQRGWEASLAHSSVLSLTHSGSPTGAVNPCCVPILGHPKPIHKVTLIFRLTAIGRRNPCFWELFVSSPEWQPERVVRRVSESLVPLFCLELVVVVVCVVCVWD